MIENILDVETWCVAQSVIPGNATLSLFDFAAAFPSLVHVYLWLALEKAAVPAYIFNNPGLV